MAKSGYKNISRIDDSKKHHHCWYVRVSWKKQSYAKQFSDKKYGGKARALQEAIAYRNQLERELGKPRSERLVLGAPRPSNTGHRGIRRVTSTQRKRGKVYSWDVYQVTYHPAPGVTKRTSVSIKKYGEDEAFRRACAIRKAAERLQYIPMEKGRDATQLGGITKRYLKTKSVCRVTFRLPAACVPEAETVHLVGDFNRWLSSSMPLKCLKDGTFTASLHLEKDKSYEYLYLINGTQWLTDPFAEDTVKNAYGGDNSVVHV